jgi:uncharacterized protein (TIRG00374 family)
MSSKRSAKKYLKPLFNIVVLIVCVFFLINKFDFKKVAEQTKDISYFVFVVSVSISLIRIWLTGLRWEALHPDNEAKLSKWNYFRFSMLAHLFNLFMPGALGGDIVKTLYAVNEQKSKQIKSVIAVIVDRVVGLISIFIFGLLALALNHNTYNFDILNLVIICTGLFVFILLIINKKVIVFFEKIINRYTFLKRFLGKIILNWKESVYYYAKNRKKVLYAYLLCIPIHLISFFIFYIFGKSLGMEISFFEMVFSVAIMWLITTLPISIGGIGVREFSLIWLLGIFNILPELAITLSIMVYINTILISLLSLPLLFDLKKKKNKAMDPDIV